MKIGKINRYYELHDEFRSGYKCQSESSNPSVRLTRDYGMFWRVKKVCTSIPLKMVFISDRKYAAE